MLNTTKLIELVGNFWGGVSCWRAALTHNIDLFADSLRKQLVRCAPPLLTVHSSVLLPSFLILILAGCRENSKSPSGAGVVRVGFLQNITHAQALIAYQRGDFTAALRSTGFDCTMQAFQAGPAIIEAIYAGHLDVAYVGPIPALNGYLRSRGQEIRLLSGAAENGTVVIGNPRRNIRRLEDLCGRRVATPQMGNTQDLAARYFLGAAGTACRSQKSADIVPIAPSDIEILMAKDQLDGAWVPEPWGSQLVSKGTGVLLTEEKSLWPEGRTPLTVVIARKKFAEEHRDIVSALLECHTSLTLELRRNKESLVPVLSEAMHRLTHKPFPESLVASSLERIEFTTSAHREGLERLVLIARQLRYMPKNAVRLDDFFLAQTGQTVTTDKQSP